MKYSGSWLAGYGGVPRTANGITARRAGASRGSRQAPCEPTRRRRATAPTTTTTPATAHGRHGRTSARSSAASHAAAVAGRSSGCCASGAASAVARRADRSGRAARNARPSAIRSALNATGPAMGVPQRVGNLAHQAQDQVGGNVCLGPESLLEGVAPYERHDEEADPLPCVEVVDAHDVGVVERCAQGRLAAEPLVPHRARRDVGGEHLHRHDMPERAVARARSEEHTSELQSPCNLVCRLLLEKKKHPFGLFLIFYAQML